MRREQDVPERVVVVGAGLGGLRAAEQLRTAGYAGEVVVLGDEPHLPYNRPPLSKEGLAGGLDHETVAFRRKASVDDVVWRLGGAQNTVTRADLAAHELHARRRQHPRVRRPGDGDGRQRPPAPAGRAAGVAARRTHPRRRDHPARAGSPAGPGSWSSAPGSSAARSPRPRALLGCEVDVVDPMPVPLVRPARRRARPRDPAPARGAGRAVPPGSYGRPHRRLRTPDRQR